MSSKPLARIIAGGAGLRRHGFTDAKDLSGGATIRGRIVKDQARRKN